MGKEHFWWIAEEVGLSRINGGELFGKLIYPLKTKTASWQAAQIMTPASLGLVVVSRSEVMLPEAPKGYNLDFSGSNRSRRLHANHPNGNTLVPAEAAIQVDGILELAKQEDLITSISGLKGATLEKFHTFSACLEQLVEFDYT